MNRYQARAVAYARSSEAGMRASIDELRQIAAIRDFCSTYNIILVSTIVEERDDSGQKGCSKLERLLSAPTDGSLPIEVIMVTSMSRISRDPTTLQAFRTRFEEMRVEFMAIDDEMAA